MLQGALRETRMKRNLAQEQDIRAAVWRPLDTQRSLVLVSGCLLPDSHKCIPCISALFLLLLLPRRTTEIGWTVVDQPLCQVNREQAISTLSYSAIKRKMLHQDHNLPHFLLLVFFFWRSNLGPYACISLIVNTRSNSL